VLQTARAATINEANGRTSLYINAVAAALIATAFVGQAASFGPLFLTFLLVVLPLVVFLGVVTFVRLLETSMHLRYQKRALALRQATSGSGERRIQRILSGATATAGPLIGLRLER
jgi:hypothetical protein